MARHHMPISVAANERIRVRTLLLRWSSFPVAVLESEASHTVGSEEARLRAGLRPPPKLHVRFSRSFHEDT
jgi:hypothetical protein